MERLGLGKLLLHCTYVRDSGLNHSNYQKLNCVFLAAHVNAHMGRTLPDFQKGGLRRDFEASLQSTRVPVSWSGALHAVRDGTMRLMGSCL